jgi:hypothetical protein
MLDFFAAVPGKLKTLLDRLSDARATKIDNLDAAITTRAAAATAVSNVDLTGTRIGYLDKLNISGNVASAAGLAAVALEATPLLSPPMASGLVSVSGAVTCADYLSARVHGLASSTTTSTSYTAVVNYTGTGVLNFLAAQSGGSGAPQSWVKLTVDGVVVAEFNSAATNYDAKIGVGALVTDGSNNAIGVALDQIAFKVSLKIELKSHNGSTVYAWYKYRKVT